MGRLKMFNLSKSFVECPQNVDLSRYPTKKNPIAVSRRLTCIAKTRLSNLRSIVRCIVLHVVPSEDGPSPCPSF